jgi:hypothetical protein
MQDRPTIDELLRAVEVLLEEQLMPTLEGARGYNARVAANVIKTVRRELRLEEEQLAREWAGLDVVLGTESRPGGAEATKQALFGRNQQLSERIRTGDADSGEWRRLVVAHLRDVTHAKLEVANPKWLQG